MHLVVHLLPGEEFIRPSADLVGVIGMCRPRLVWGCYCLAVLELAMSVVAGLLVGGSWLPVSNKNVS